MIMAGLVMMCRCVNVQTVYLQTYSPSELIPNSHQTHTELKPTSLLFDVAIRYQHGRFAQQVTGAQRILFPAILWRILIMSFGRVRIFHCHLDAWFAKAAVQVAERRSALIIARIY